MSIVVLEAGMTKTPVLLTDRCGFDAVESIGGGKVVPATVEGLEAGLAKLLDRPEVLRPMGIRLYRYVSENFTWIGFSILSAWGFTWIDGLGYGGQGTLALGLIFVGVVGGHVLFGWAGDALERRHPQLGRVWLGQLSMVANLLGVLGFVALGDRSLLLLGASGLLIGLATSSRGSGAFSPLLQGILLPELRATGQGLVDMTLGLLSAAALGLSGWVLARVGEDVQRMMLLMVPTTTLLGGVLWSGFFRTYPRDLAAIHNTLLQQRQEILERRTG